MIAVTPPLTLCSKDEYNYLKQHVLSDGNYSYNNIIRTVTCMFADAF